MRAVVYSRVSTEEQNPRSQLEVVMDYAGKRGYEVVRVFEENISGSVNLPGETCLQPATRLR